MDRRKTPFKFLIVAFATIVFVIVYQNLLREKTVNLEVKDNKGTSLLETADGLLVCVFQDGKTCIWDWNNSFAELGEFKAESERAIVLNSELMAAVNATGKKVLTAYSLPSGQKQKELSVGWEDQEVWPRISLDKKVAALIRKNPADSAGSALYEFMMFDIEKDVIGLPASLSIKEKTEVLTEFALDSANVIYAAGSRDKIGRIAAVNLQNGSVLWDRVFEDTKEFCSIIVSPDGYLLAGNHDGILYKIRASDGSTDKKIILLQPGETRPVTNDYSVLNLAFSPDGQYYVATINPQAYLLYAADDKIIHTLAPADKLVSKIAFSPDNAFIATSDIRASYPIKIWPLNK